MKKVLFLVIVCFAASSSYGQDKLVRKARTLYDGDKAGEKLDECEATLKPALESAETKKKAEAWDLYGKIEDRRHIIEGRKAQAKQPFDTLAFYNHLNNCINAYVKADQIEKADPDFEAPSKIKEVNKLQIERYRQNLALCGDIFNQQKKYDMAYEAFDKWLNVPKLSIFDGDKDAFKNDTVLQPAQIAYYACLCGYNAKDNEKAMKHFDEAKLYAPEKDQVYLLKSIILKDQGDTVKWAAFLREAAVENPSHPEFAERLVSIYQIQGKKKEAMAFVDEILAKDPANKSFQYLKGVALFNDGKYVDAAPYFKKAGELDPTSVDAFQNEGTCYMNSAYAIFQTLPKNANDPKYKAGETKIKDLYKKAEPCFERVRQLAPNDKDSWAPKLKNIYSNLQEKDKLAELNKATGGK